MNALAQQPGLSRGTRVAVWSCASALLLLPLVAMQFTSEVNWSSSDFAVFAGMLVILIGAIEVSVKYLRERTWRIAAIALALATFLIVWALLATG